MAKHPKRPRDPNELAAEKGGGKKVITDHHYRISDARGHFSIAPSMCKMNRARKRSRGSLIVHRICIKRDHLNRTRFVPASLWQHVGAVGVAGRPPRL